MSEPKVRSAAVLTLRDAARMTPKGRREIARWLERQARDLVEFGDQYSGTLRARYFRVPRDCR